MAELATGIVSGVHLIEDGDMVVHAARERRGFETRSLAVWKNLAEPGSLLVDVGAYTGVYAIAAAKRGARVIAFEPSDAAADRLEQNAAINGVSVTLHRAAAWRKAGRLTLRGKEDKPLSSARSVVRHGDRVKIATVDAVALDDVIAGPVRAIKIDAERAEPEILAGTKRVIAESRPVLLVEELDEQATAAVTAQLAPLGYRREDLGQSMVVWWP